MRDSKFFVGSTYDAYYLAYGDGDALGDDDAAEEAGGEGLDLYGGLVGLHFDYGFTPVDVVAFGFEPADDGAFLHVEAHLGHYHVGGQGSASFELATSTAK